MTHLRGDWILWAVFGISLALVAFTYFAGQRPSQQLIMIQLLGLGCGLIAPRCAVEEGKNSSYHAILYVLHSLT